MIRDYLGNDLLPGDCRQVGHAESMAIDAALGSGARVERAQLTVTHTHACSDCQAMLAAYAINEVFFVGAPDA